MRIYSWKKPELIVTQTTGGSLIEGTTYYLYARFRYTTGGTNNTCASQSPRTDVIPITITAGNSAFNLGWKTSGNITAYSSGGTGITVVTSNRHCLDSGNVVTILSGTYAGTYTITWLSYNTFSIPTAYSVTETSS